MFADYDEGEEQKYDLTADVRALPAAAGVAGRGYYLHGIDFSDDLMMLLKRRLGPADGIEPNRTYRLIFQIDMVSGAGGRLGLFVGGGAE